MTGKIQFLNKLPSILFFAIIPLTAYTAYGEGVSAPLFYGLLLIAEILAAFSIFSTIRTERQAGRRVKSLNETNKQLQDYINASWISNRKILHEEKIRAIKFMMMGIAHEINTPVGNALTSVSILEDLLEKHQIGDADVQSALNLSQKSIKRTIDLITRFKEVAQISLKEEKTDFKLADLLDNIGNLKNHEWSKKNVQLKIDCPENYILDSFPHSLSIILIILLDNACDSLTDESGYIELSCQQLDRDIKLTVSDSGMGIKQEHIEEVFNPFFTTVRSENHLGLGLSTAHNLTVNLFEGDIKIDSEWEKGTSVTLSLPGVFSPAKVNLEYTG